MWAQACLILNECPFCADEIGERYGEFRHLSWILGIHNTKTCSVFEVIILLIILIWSLCFVNEYVLNVYTVPAKYAWSECTENKNTTLEMVQLEKLHRHGNPNSVSGTHIKASCSSAGLWCQHWGNWDKMIRGACWPAHWGKPSNSRFSERMSFKRKRKTVVWDKGNNLT